MAVNPQRRKLLERLVPEGMVVTRKWLMDHVGLQKHAIDNLVKSEQLKLLQKGVYMRGNVRVSWQSIVYALQTVMKKDYVVGGVTALELKGFSHYLPNTRKKTVHLYGDDKLPAWINALVDDTVFVRHSRRELLDAMPAAKVGEYTSLFSWKEELEELKLSCPEKACLEVLNEVPENISFEHAEQLMQGMVSLSPRTMQKLLEQCSNVKVKRLFLWMGARHNYVWYAKLKTEHIYLGSGNRMLVRGGMLDKKYKITVPKDFQS